ncbi:hypothetical protein [Polyangium fumosum]|uniref:Uncharacterized protein n=1 Tax=Polyangium fumosum TaxID=889272 RepID=A0A4U1J0G6_9BACT|nr:hypothetical protein [Polyangium fumosum]TKD00408.1 hypothetical protein E8A74_34505 [Polyangium fumosum]
MSDSTSPDFDVLGASRSLSTLAKGAPVDRLMREVREAVEAGYIHGSRAGDQAISFNAHLIQHNTDLLAANIQLSKQYSELSAKHEATVRIEAERSVALKQIDAEIARNKELFSTLTGLWNDPRIALLVQRFIGTAGLAPEVRTKAKVVILALSGPEGAAARAEIRKLCPDAPHWDALVSFLSTVE